MSANERLVLDHKHGAGGGAHAKKVSDRTGDTMHEHRNNTSVVAENDPG